MRPQLWPCPLPGGGIAEEYALVFDQDRQHRLLIVPALFEESNRVRRFTAEVMRRLDLSSIDCFLPDFPGQNESLQPLEVQACDDWRDAMASAAAHFGATHVLGIRGGCLFTPARLPGWHYAPAKGATSLRQMIRARILASREAGREESTDALMEIAVSDGIELSGYRIGPELITDFRDLTAIQSDKTHIIGQDMIGGSGLWLRAEPDENRDQADALAAVIAVGLGS